MNNMSLSKGTYNLRKQNLPKGAISKGNKNSKLTPTKRSDQASSQRTPPQQLAPNSNRAMATAHGQTSPDASNQLPPIPGEDSPNTAMLVEIRKMFCDFTTPLNEKLDHLMTDFVGLKQEVEQVKSTIRDLETSAHDTSARMHSVESEKLPNMEKKFAKLKADMEEKLILQEMHNRKQNLLFYGVGSHSKEDIYDTTHTVIADFLDMPKEEAAKIPLINAHRLPTRKADGAASNDRPEPIIVRFARMADRDKVLRAFEQPRRETNRTGPQPPNRLTVRTDLPAAMKRERGRLANIAFDLRKNHALKTRIVIQGTKVILQTKKLNEPSTNWSKWSD